MDDIKKLLGDFADAWGRRDVGAVVELFADDAVYFASVGPEPGRRATGKTAIRELIEAMFAVDRGATSETTEPVIFDGGAFWSWRYTLPDGSIELGCDLLRVADGKIVLKDAYRKVRAD
ncbi:MAG: nuclear transport factor 2 family protein [Brucellaceae bacterium]|nr:nuclear transport factor 2 family protein [Brucellaceae bacterium]